MFERFRRSWQLAKDSWGVLKSNKRFMMFPLLSGLFCVLVLLSFVIPLAAVRDKWMNMVGGPPGWLYVVGFLYYVATYFVIVFFNAALVHCAIMKMNGEDPTVGDGIRAAMARFPQILAWAVVSATVGIILKAIENANEKAGYWVSLILGTVWTVITFFVVPVLVVEKAGPFQAIGRSTAILKKTWGEALIGSFGIGLFGLLLFIPVVLLMLVTGMVWAAMGPTAGIMMLVITIVALLVWAAAYNALEGIYVSALYQYAAFERVPQGYDEDTLKGAFYGKK